MTRRIALAIFLTVWAILLIAGGGAYVTTRAILLSDLDGSLLARAASLPELVHSPAMPWTEQQALDRYIVRNDVGQTVARPAIGAAYPAPILMSANFSKLADGQRVRTITVSALAKPATEGGTPRSVTVVYSGSCDRFDALLKRLAGVLTFFGLGAGLVTAGVAVYVSRASLLPLRHTVQLIGSIDERKLDRRIELAALPRELIPMGLRLNEMLARLEQAFAQRRQFLADASHELRTPVAALVTTLEVALRRPRPAAELGRILQSCLGDARFLRRLIEALLDQVRSERLVHSEPVQSIDVVEVLDECADTLEGLAVPREVRLLRQFPRALRFNTQPTRLRSIVMNLLSNAVEYNHRGGTVEICCADAGDAMELVVRDTGPGIAPEHLEHLFEPFYRADSARHQDDSQHVGLGLSLVRSHVLAMGGNCQVSSQVGQGCTFTVRLPGACLVESAVDREDERRGEPLVQGAA